VFNWMKKLFRKKMTSLPVVFYVLRDTQGFGNELWTQAYCLSVINAANLLLGDSKFHLNYVVDYLSQDYYLDSMQTVLERYDGSVRRTSELAVIIAGPGTVDAAGLSQIMMSTRPYFAMRHRDGEDVFGTARIFLHEMGHNLNLRHTGDPHADNWYTTAPGLMSNYLSWLSERR
jgi:hypothetical protein